MPGPSRPFLVGHSGVLKSFFWGAAPWAPGVYPPSGMGCEYPCEGTADRSGLTPSAGPAVRRGGTTALHYAALRDERAIVAALLGARADVNAQHNNGCAFAVGAVRRGGRRRPMVTPMAAVPAPSGRHTALLSAVYIGSISVVAELLVGGADQTITDKLGYRRAAHKPRRRTAPPDRCRRTPRQVAARCNKLGAYDAAVAQARPPHRRRCIARARRWPPPASSRTPRMHLRWAACRGRVLRRTPTHPRHDLRVALRAIGCCCRTAEGRARTYRIAAHSAREVAHAALTGT
jgi:hypothetical protein